MNESFIFSELIRKFNNIIRFGTVTETDHKKARIKVTTGNITTNWIPWATAAGNVRVWNPPAMEEQGILLSQGGDLALAVAISSVYRNKFTASSDNENIVHMKLSDKTSFEFNREDDSITIQLNDAEITANNGEISDVLGNAKINMRKEKTEISVGDAKIEITPEKIGLYATVIDAPNLKVEL